MVLFLLLILTLAALPLWLPWVVKPALARFDVDYQSYERIGYARFALTDTVYERKGVRVEVGRLEGFGPAGWLWNRWRGVTDVDYLAVADWRVEIEEFEEAPTVAEVEEGPDDVSVYDIFTGIEEALPRVIYWAPRTTLGGGVLVVGDREIEVRGAEWRQGKLTAEVFDPTFEQTVAFEGDVSQGLPFSFQGRIDPFPFSIEVTVTRLDERVVLSSEAFLADNLLEADAEFPRRGYLPEQARFRSENFELPREYFDLEGYEDVRGSLLLEWREGRFTADLMGRANPVRGFEGRLPPLRVEASARGDLESFLVEALEVRSPWLVASLSDPVAMDYSGELLSDRSTFRLAADLKEQPFVALRGLVRGEMRISPGEERLPVVAFTLEGVDLAGFDLELDRVELDGYLRWPELGIATLLVEGRDDSSATGHAVIDLEEMEITGGRIEGMVRSALISRWLPDDVGFSRASFGGTFEGPVRDLEHQGIVELEEAVAPAIHPVNGRLEWEGRMENLSSFAVELLAGVGRLGVTGSTRFDEERVEISLDDFRLERADEPLLEAAGPSRFLVDWAGENVTISLDQLEWVGEERGIIASAEAAWPRRGRFQADLRNLHAGLVTDFVDIESGIFKLNTAELSGSWEEGPIDFAILAEVEMEFDDGDVLFALDARGEEELQVETLRATSRGEVLVFAEGRLPVAIWPGRERVLAIKEDGPIDFRASTDPEADFWQEIGEITGIHLHDPQLSLEIAGTPLEPSGHLVGGSSRIDLRAFENEDRPIPHLRNFRIETRFDVDRFRVAEFSLDVEGQRLEAEVTLPMGTEEWQALVQERRLPDWERATGNVTIPEARLAAFTRFAPTVLSPQGILEANIDILPGGQLDGLITVENAATRPLMPLGTIREGTARIVLRGRTAHVEEVSAVIGGERLMVRGVVDIPFEQALAFDLNMSGRNLPLTRQPGVVIRGDVNLFARSRDGAVPVISGRVDLRDSFYLAHLRLMPAGSVATPDRRPPFFSVTQEPFSDWRLNVDLRGPGFLNVRGPIFQGEISANFNLSGTLVEPRAIGAAIIDSGRVRFPFASMRIDQGEISLPREDPFQPQLFIIASGMAFGYDLTMEIGGTAEAPIIEFISNPPLSSEQVLLMVTTGELPREEIRFTTQQRASRFAIYFGQNLLYEITGDDAAGDRLTIRTGEQVSEGGRETMAIEFKLTDRWSVTGEYDRFDEYNAGFKWNIYTR